MEWAEAMRSADPSEFHWVVESGNRPSIVEFRGKWYWTDETENFGNLEPCATREEAEVQQKEYCDRYL